MGYQNLLNKSLAEVFGRKARHDLANGMMLRELGKRSHDLGLVQLGPVSLLASSSFAKDLTVFEFEAPPDTGFPASQPMQELHFLMQQVKDAQTEQQLFDISVQLLRTLTGYDRVMVYKFDAEGHGEVKAEAVTAGITQYLGLRFPAWDIPDQARELMRKIPIRCISDINAEGVPVHAAMMSLPPLDMTYSYLRGTSRVHREYLRNMGTEATFTMNINIDGRLWGILSFHHRTPRFPDQRVRQVCRSFIDVFQMKLGDIEKSSKLRHLDRADRLRRRMAARTEQSESPRVFEAELLKDLSDLMKADGAALILRDSVVRVGLTPESVSLLRDLKKRDWEDGLTSTSHLSRDFPDISAELGAEYAGLLVAKPSEDCLFLFFRRGVSSVVKWAGAPDKSQALDRNRLQLNPRNSFEEYRETVEGQSVSWSPEQQRIASELWSILITSERSDLIEKTNRQQSLLIDELNHRVRNILALIRSLSQQTLSHNGSINSYVSALEARIAAVASAHDLGAEKSNLDATLQQIVEQEAAPYNQEERRVKVSGFDAGIRADLAPMFALVIHEMMTNAVKYGALSNDTGWVSIRITRDLAGVELEWREQGGPVVSSTGAKGFGTTLIKQSVPFELDGNLIMNFEPEGVMIKISLPAKALTEKSAISQPEATVDAVEGAGGGNREVDFRPLRCLLVEDNYVVSLDTARVLKMIGFEIIETAMNVTDALSKIDSFVPDVALLDINLSEGHTSEPIARELRSRGIPFVFVSGYGDTMKLDAVFAGCPVLKKPVSDTRLQSLLAKVLQ